MNPLIHIVQVVLPKKGSNVLFLRKNNQDEYSWSLVNDLEEELLNISGPTPADAIQRLIKHFRCSSFKTIKCGTRFTLPERDEHGTPALFHQMASSYSSPNGVYQDEEYGGPCIVNNASLEALNFWRLQRQSKKS